MLGLHLPELFLEPRDLLSALLFCKLARTYFLSPCVLLFFGLVDPPLLFLHLPLQVFYLISGILLRLGCSLERISELPILSQQFIIRSMLFNDFDDFDWMLNLCFFLFPVFGIMA